MRQSFSLSMKINTNEEGLYNAAISYNDGTENEINVSAEGKDIEDVCWSLYDKLEDEIYAAEQEKKALQEEISDKDYIAYLEDYVKQLKEENQALRQQPIQNQKKENMVDKTIKNKQKKTMSNQDIIEQLNEILEKYGF